MKPSAANAKIQAALDALAAQVADLADKQTLTLGLVAAIAEAVSPAVAEASAHAETTLRSGDLTGLPRPVRSGTKGKPN
jgi:hypothetical protein